MNRRIRSSSACHGHAAPRGALVGLAISLGLGLLAAACSSDLFHDTKWQSRCDAEPDAAICPQGTGGAGGMNGASATTSASTTAASTSGSSASSTAGAGGGTSTSTGSTAAASSSSSG